MIQPDNEESTPVAQTKPRPRPSLAEQGWWQELARGATAAAGAAIVTGLVQWAQNLL
ncbi:hypothetical protein TPA0910_87400 [Streptomyces hygroscopicus subsp. sporocinereus]|uniref:Uncharacterized protein n=1 Tax=Streptomyces hygroscopicus TaxID=1912 RepID=A0ABQ3UFD9_STRHY|nr:hypothetical protein [Streptomyces hygroscopicus]GHJ34307.1 hypothetical protein TPA0910_87400 [Streptomyces hygroscopicus]